MKGTVRAWCGKCKKQWDAGSSENSKLPPFCQICYIPVRYYVDIYHKGRIKIYYSQLGLPLDSYVLACQALHAIRYEITNNRFDKTRYVKQDQAQFQFQNAWKTYYEAEAFRPDLETGSLEGKRWASRYLLGHYGAEDIRDITGADLVKLKTKLLKNLAPKTVRNILGTLGHFLRWCHTNGLIRESLPLVPTVKLSKKVPIWLDEGSQEKVLQEISEEHRGIYMFCMDHGTRPGEARALQWGDIEWDVRVVLDGEEMTVDLVTIRRAWGRKTMKPTKTEDERQLILHPQCKAWMLKHRRLNPLDLVFVKLDGSPYSRMWLARHWNVACRQAGIERVTLYQGTRHSFASQCAMAGGNLKDLQVVLGHTDIRTTMRYTHEDLRAAMRTIGRRGTVHRLSTAKKSEAKNE